MAIRPAGLLALLLVASVFAGCTVLDEGDGIERSIEIVESPTEQDTRGEDEYWMVWIRGNETDEREPQAVCDRLPQDFRIEPGDESVVYDNRSYDFDPGEVRVLLAFDHEDRSSACPEAEHLLANPGSGHEQAMGEYGELTLTVEADGSLVLDGREVPLTKAAQVTYQGTPEDPNKIRVDGSFRAETLGAWPQENLQAGQP